MEGPTLRTTSGALITICPLSPDQCEHCGAALPFEGSACTLCAKPCAINQPVSLEHLSGATLESERNGGSERAPPKTPQLIRLGTKREWQLMPCPICGPLCHTTNHFAAPEERLRLAREKVGAAEGTRAWGKALEYSHVCIGAITKDTSPLQVSEVHCSASLAQLKLGGPRSALRHANLALAAAESAAAHQRRGQALEALGQIVAAKHAFSRALLLEGEIMEIEAALARLTPLVELLAEAREGRAEEGAGEERAEGKAGEAMDGRQTCAAYHTRYALRRLSESNAPLFECRCELVGLLRSHGVKQGNGEEGEILEEGRRGDRLLQMLSLDAAIEAERQSTGEWGSVRTWLLVRARELGMEVLEELLEWERGEEGSGEETSEEEGSDNEFDRQLLGLPRGEKRANRVVSAELSSDHTHGRGVMQIELCPARLQLSFSHTSLEPKSFGALLVECSFLIGMGSICLAEAETIGSPGCSFARWHPVQRGPLEILNEPLANKSALAIVEYFSDNIKDDLRLGLAPQ